MNRLQRLLRHLRVDERHAHKVLPRVALARLRQRVQAGEQRHSGEIRVHVESHMPLAEVWQGVTPRQRAVMLFGQLGVWDTEHNNGVLIYLLLAERAIEIVADRGLHAHVPAQHWDALVRSMGAAFRAGRYEEGLGAAIDAVNTLLVQHFALQPGETHLNELPDAPTLG